MECLSIRPSRLQWWYNADQYQQNHASNLAIVSVPDHSFEMSGYPYALLAHKLYPCGTPSIHLHLSNVSSVEHTLSNPAAWPFKDNLSHGSALYLSYIQLELEDLGYYHKYFRFYERYILWGLINLEVCGLVCNLCRYILKPYGAGSGLFYANSSIWQFLMPPAIFKQPRWWTLHSSDWVTANVLLWNPKGWLKGYIVLNFIFVCDIVLNENDFNCLYYFFNESNKFHYLLGTC